MNSFYYTVLAQLKEAGELGTTDRILVVCGGPLDRDELVSQGFADVVISSLDAPATREAMAPYRFEAFDAEELPCASDEFDVVIVHEGLHHCRSPHRALLEMLRVARKGVLVIESRDSLFLRAGVAAGLVADYEFEAVVANDCRSGGLRNGAIPNFVYRWTEREVIKTLQAANPALKLDIRFFYATILPIERLSMTRNFLKRMVFAAAIPVIRLISVLLPQQGNRFGFWVRKEGAPLRPWLIKRNGEIALDPDFVRPRFRNITGRLWR